MDGLWLRVYVIYYQINLIFNMSEEGMKTNGIIKKFHTALDSVLNATQNKEIILGKLFKLYSIFNSTNFFLIEKDRPTFLGYLMDKYKASTQEIKNRMIRDEIMTLIIAVILF